MNFDDIHLFCLVVETESVSEAAKRKFISQPAASKKIQSLESVFQANLFHREKGKLILTSVGEILYDYAKEIIYLKENAEREMQYQLNLAQKTIYIGASLTIGEYLLPKIIYNFNKIYPLIHFSVSIGNTPQIINDLYNNKVDLALVDLALVESPIDNDLIIKRFAEDQLILLANDSNPLKFKNNITINDIRNEKLLWREKESGTRKLIENRLKKIDNNFILKQNLILGSMQAIKTGIITGLGISFLPRITVENELNLGLLHEIPIKELNIKRDFWLVKKHKRFKSQEEQTFEKFILTQASDMLNNT